MNEQLLHFVWKFQLFNKENLYTTQGDKVEIVNAGIYNADAGADFQNAKVRIGKTLWAGSIEIHVNSSDWFKHHHQKDNAYNSVVLHVVYDDFGKAAINNNNCLVPTILLRGRIKDLTLCKYNELSKERRWIPCAGFFSGVDTLIRDSWAERLLAERLENKVKSIENLLQQCEHDWENVLFQQLSKYMGAPVNSEPFLQLAQALPVKLWAKHAGNKQQIEALVFGQAGFLTDKPDDVYVAELRKEFMYLKKLYNLKPLEKHIWKFMRLRPANFPTLRLAQLAALMNGSGAKMFSKAINSNTSLQLLEILSADVSEYWHTHYMIDKPVESRKAYIGSSTKDMLVINAVVPILFAYGKYKCNDSYCDMAVQMLQEIKAEHNVVTKGWQKLEWRANSASTSQAMLQLKSVYCSNFKCLQCAIGTSILK